MVKQASFSGWRERFHAVAMRRNGGERSWIWAAVHLSTTIMGAPQLGQVQRGLGCLAAETPDSICGCGTRPSTCRQSGSRVERRRLARKPKLRMRTKLPHAPWRNSGPFRSKIGDLRQGGSILPSPYATRQMHGGYTHSGDFAPPQSDRGLASVSTRNDASPEAIPKWSAYWLMGNHPNLCGFSAKRA